jgi:phosphoribosylaminoimidazolecarboxamide formyltransferase/IMP cyclohydrolase
MKMQRAVISVSTKAGLAEFAPILKGLQVEIISTGGTKKYLDELKVNPKDISEHTGFPEIMDGRVKTLHPKVHGGILNIRDKKEHQDAMSALGISHIDMIVVNLYPFKEVVAKGCTFEDAIENIDIGGPSMIRAAAKNYRYVTVVVDPADYPRVMDEMKALRRDDRGVRSSSRRSPFLTSDYDRASSTTFQDNPQ